MSWLRSFAFPSLRFGGGFGRIFDARDALGPVARILRHPRSLDVGVFEPLGRARHAHQICGRSRRQSEARETQMIEAKTSTVANGARERHVWKVTINAPIETVWNTLVKTDEVLPFFFGAVCDTEGGIKVGKTMRMVSKNRKYAI